MENGTLGKTNYGPLTGLIEYSFVIPQIYPASKDAAIIIADRLVSHRVSRGSTVQTYLKIALNAGRCYTLGYNNHTPLNLEADTKLCWAFAILLAYFQQLRILQEGGFIRLCPGPVW